MPASNTFAADAPTVGQSHTSLNEPSMEDILASIRRIIAEDQSNNLGRSGLTGLARRASQPAPAPLKDAEPAMPRAEAEPIPDVVADSHAIELSIATEVHPDHAVPLETPDDPTLLDVGIRGSHDSVGFDQATHHEDGVVDDAPALPAGGLQAAVEHPAESYDEDRVLELSELDQLPSVAEQEPLISSAAGASITSSFQTLADTVLMQDPGLVERIMRETLRPMLKTWLDDHLPSLVERLVRAEIERVARGGRSRD